MKQKRQKHWQREYGCLIAVILPFTPFLLILFVCAIASIDLRHPVTRIEYAMEANLHDNAQILSAKYQRGWIDDRDSLSISLILPKADFENLVLKYCSSLESIRSADDDRGLLDSYPQYIYIVNWAGECGAPFMYLMMGVKNIDDNGMYTVDIWGETYCASPDLYRLGITNCEM